MMRYKKIKPEFKQTFFNELKKDFMKTINNPKYSETFFSNLNYGNKKLFEQVLISNNIFEFDHLRNAYANKMKSNNLVKKIDFNKLFSEIYKQYWDVPQEEKDDYFISMKNFVVELYQDELYYDIFNKITFRNKKIMEQIAVSTQSSEFDMIRELYNNRNRIDDLSYKRQVLLNEYESVKEFNESLKSSNSLKLAKLFKKG